jgi:exodeoxyribonuclease VII large subunit
MENSLSLIELNQLVRRTIELTLPDEYWVQAELSDVRVNSSGHCYVEFVQKDERGNNLLAKARGNIWMTTYRRIKPYFEQSTGQLFTSGIKVLVRVSVSFHELYGYSLVVKDIDPSYTLGDMARRRREILEQLRREGVLTLNKELPFPLLPQRIAVISSPTAAGYGDFCNQLAANTRGFHFDVTLFSAVMQGDRVEASILAALDQVLTDVRPFDVVVIIRGGGATSDLSGFDTYLLAAACAQFPIPIITGIGHERDDTVIDAVAHTRVKTPTAAAEYLIGRMTEAADRVATLADELRTAVLMRLDYEHRRLQTYQARIPALVMRRFSAARLQLETLQTGLHRALPALLTRHHYQLELLRQRLATVSPALLVRYRHQLELLRQRIADASPQKLLSRGYSITLKDGRAVKDATVLREGDLLETHFAHGHVRSTVAPPSDTSHP